MRARRSAGKIRKGERGDVGSDLRGCGNTRARVNWQEYVDNIDLHTGRSANVLSVICPPFQKEPV